MTAFDRKRAYLVGPDRFPRLRLPSRGAPIEGAKLADDTPVLVIERGGERLAVLVRDMVYHHLAQGELAGEPYIVSF